MSVLSLPPSLRSSLLFTTYSAAIKWPADAYNRGRSPLRGTSQDSGSSKEGSVEMNGQHFPRLVYFVFFFLFVFVGLFCLLTACTFLFLFVLCTVHSATNAKVFPTPYSKVMLTPYTKVFLTPYSKVSRPLTLKFFRPLTLKISTGCLKEHHCIIHGRPYVH